MLDQLIEEPSFDTSSYQQPVDQSFDESQYVSMSMSAASAKW